MLPCKLFYLHSSYVMGSVFFSMCLTYGTEPADSGCGK